MAETSFEVEERGCRSVEEETKGNIGDAAHDPFDEIVGEAQMCKYHTNVEPICLVESLSKIEFEDDAFEFFVFDGVQNLLSSANSFMYLALV